MKHRLKRLLKSFSSIPVDVRDNLPSACMNCGHHTAYMLDPPLVLDFELSRLPPALRPVFRERLNGICTACGIYQSFSRFSDSQIREINALGKDISTSFEAFQQYPPSASSVREIDETFYRQRLKQWNAYFSSATQTVKNALFLRPWFGQAVKFVLEKWKCDVSGLDMSPICNRYVQEHFPTYKLLEGFINGALEGNFVNDKGFDAVFVFHVMTHACDFHKTLQQIRKLVRPNGFALFTHDAMRKPTNPFHMNHLSEWQFVGFLKQYFSRIDRIDHCTEQPPRYIADFSQKNDDPDFVAWA